MIAEKMVARGCVVACAKPVCNCEPISKQHENLYKF